VIVSGWLAWPGLRRSLSSSAVAPQPALSPSTVEVASAPIGAGTKVPSAQAAAVSTSATLAPAKSVAGGGARPSEAPSITVSPSPEKPAALGGTGALHAGSPVSLASASPQAVEGSHPTGATSGEETPAEGSGNDPSFENPRLERAEDLFDKGRFGSALAEARAVLARDPRNTRAKELSEDAEVELVVESRLKAARSAIERGDNEAALELVRSGLAAKPTDGRLMALWKQLTKE
jgi:hypothetical protein